MILQISDNIRIRRLDRFSLVIEKQETNRNPRTKKLVTSWNLFGYYSTIFQAIEAISRHERLIDEEKIKNISDYVAQVEESNNKLIDFIKVVKGDSK